jgi:DNA-binding beta-propeller fold protein YncE/mono/diheme cytochrome c family protein
MRASNAGLLGLGLLVSACGGASIPTERAEGAPAEARGEVGHAVSCARRHPGVGAARVGLARQGSTVALARIEDRLVAYVADADTDAIRTFDVEAGVEKAVTPLGGSPSQVLVLADGRVAVALRDRNRVEIFEPAGGAEVPLEGRCSAPVAVEPVGLAATPDEGRIVVTSAWGRKLSTLDAGTLAAGFEVDLAREPRSVVIDDDGQRAFVAHVVGAKLSVVDLGEGKHEVRELDLRVKGPLQGKSSSKLREGCQGFALAKSISTQPDLPVEAPIITEVPRGDDVKVITPKPARPRAPRARIFAPMVTVDPGQPEARSTGYGSTNTMAMGAELPIVSVIDGAAERPLTRALLSDGAKHDGGCLLPRAAAVSAAGDALYVTCLGTDALLELDTRGLDPSRLERRRWALPAGPTGVAVDDRGARAVVWSQFDRQLSVVTIGGEAAVRSVVASASGARRMIAPGEAWGRRLFHAVGDRRISGDGRACASCHPDGREDALTWSTPEGPRQTIMLAGRIEGSAPYGWMGAHADLKAHLGTTLARLGGLGLPDNQSAFDDLDALAAYVSAMPAPVTFDARPDPTRAALVTRGDAIFHEARQGCAACHVGGKGTDALTHDIGSAVSADRDVPFDTPSLRFVGGTAPYFHDGRYATLDALLSGADGRMGHTLQLSRRDAQSLRAYLETL